MTVFTATAAGYTLFLRLTQRGQDVLVELFGGDVPHYGVVTTVGRDGVQTHALPSRPGHVHQEGALTTLIAQAIQPVLQGNAIITGGMHVDLITHAQMQAAFDMTATLAAQARDWLAAHPRPTRTEKFAN